MEKDLEKLTLLYNKEISGGGVSFIALPGAASNRRYYRMASADGTSYIGAVGANLQENKAFVQLARALAPSVNVPEVMAVASDYSCYIQQDLGSRDLLSYVKGPECRDLVRESLKQLVNFQTLPVAQWEGIVMCSPFSMRQALWDLNYFKYEFFLPLGIEFDAEALEDDFQQLAFMATNLPCSTVGLQYRDFQSRNIMILDGAPYLIDFQGSKRGPVVYDAISLLWQSRAGFSKEFRRDMLDYYCELYSSRTGAPVDELHRQVPTFLILRTLQVLGAYGFRGLVEKKSQFVVSIPSALENLNDLIDEGYLDSYPELRRICQLIVGLPKFQRRESDRLKVEIFSFSYKKGYPEDLTGNGGGFMFDCRAMHNPGRYEQYKALTGRDLPVIEFLEERGEVQPFLKAAWQLTDPAVARYLQRGFTNLQIGFGCTGGQHRSVYCAEATARHIRETFPEAEVSLIHREQKL